MTETKHSPEPWRHNDGTWMWDANGAAHWFDIGGEFSAENKRRVIACVNACAGIPTEVLKYGHLREALVTAGCIGAFTSSEWRDVVTRLYEALGRTPVDAQEPHGEAIGRPGGQEGG